MDCAESSLFFLKCKISPLDCAESSLFFLKYKISPMDCAKSSLFFLKCKISPMDCAESAISLHKCKICVMDYHKNFSHHGSRLPYRNYSPTEISFLQLQQCGSSKHLLQTAALHTSILFLPQTPEASLRKHNKPLPNVPSGC